MTEVIAGFKPGAFTSGDWFLTVMPLYFFPRSALIFMIFFLLTFQAFGSRVLGLSRGGKTKENPFEEVFERRKLPEFLSRCDYICAILPKTPETDEIVGGGILEHCKGKK